MRIAIVIVALMLCAGAVASQPAPGLLVTPAWLAEHLQDPSLVVLQAGSLRADYDRAHIPGARFLWLNWIAENSPEGTLEMPSPSELARQFENLGVSSDSRVVIAGMLGSPMVASRVFVALDYLGMGDRTHILDGGLEAWEAEGRPVTTEAPKSVRRGRLAPKVRPEVLADLAWVSRHYRDDGVRLVDSRPAMAFQAPRLFMASTYRGGHIPGAVLVPYGSLVDGTGRFQPPDTLRARFESAGVKSGEQVISYCGVGAAASMAYVAARVAGYPVRLYDGSFEEWSRHTELPVEGEGGK